MESKQTSATSAEQNANVSVGSKSDKKLRFWVPAAIVPVVVLGLVWSLGTEQPAETATAASGPVAKVQRVAVRKPQPVVAAAPRPQPAVEFKTVNKVLVAVRNANVRAKPSTRAAKTDVLVQGAKVTVTGLSKPGTPGSGKWYRIARANGGVGYVYSTLLEQQIKIAKTASPAAESESRTKRTWRKIKGTVRGWTDSIGSSDGTPIQMDELEEEGAL